MFHEDGDDDVDEHKLRHQHEDYEEHRSDDSVDTAVAHAVRVRVAVVLQGILTHIHTQGHTGIPRESTTGHTVYTCHSFAHRQTDRQRYICTYVRTVWYSRV